MGDFSLVCHSCCQLFAAFRGVISTLVFMKIGFSVVSWLGLFPSSYIFINVFLNCFCTVYAIRLFGRCSKVLDPALYTY